jgi:hypothetical protein
MNLLETQMKFTKMVPKLINKAFKLGFYVTLGDAYRDARCRYGSPKTFHRKRLAIDLNLFRYDKDTGKFNYCTETEDHRELGEWWKSQGGTWGGDFRRPDGNHYSWGEK